MAGGGSKLANIRQLTTHKIERKPNKNLTNFAKKLLNTLLVCLYFCSIFAISLRRLITGCGVSLNSPSLRQHTWGKGYVISNSADWIFCFSRNFIDTVLPTSNSLIHQHNTMVLYVSRRQPPTLSPSTRHNCSRATVDTRNHGRLSGGEGDE